MPWRNACLISTKKPARCGRCGVMANRVHVQVFSLDSLCPACCPICRPRQGQQDLFRESSHVPH